MSSALQYAPGTQSIMNELGSFAHKRLATICRSPAYLDLVEFHTGHPLQRWSTTAAYADEASLDSAEECMDTIQTEIDALVRDVNAHTGAAMLDEGDWEMVMHSLTECISDRLPVFALWTARNALFSRMVA